MVYEYKVIPAPTKGRKARGVRKPEDKFALSVQEAMNEMAQLGWEFLRSETLPNTERTGLTRHTTTDRSLLVFRRGILEPATSSLEATLRDVEKPKPIVAPVSVDTEHPVAEEPEVAKAAPPLVEPAPAPVAETVVPLSPPEPKEPVVDVMPPEPDPAPKPAKKRLAAIDETGFPNPRGSETPMAASQALYTKDSVKTAKSGKPNALPAALRSRASQSQDGKKA